MKGWGNTLKPPGQFEVLTSSRNKDTETKMGQRNQGKG